ncbi:phage tail termination protein [Streptomyces syringium]|uniref:phage tail termination protein n=1 Tax=Streptomyces syringium TaxID=76729 RepID=UPI003452AC19
MSARWPDAEAALIAWLPRLLDGPRVCTDAPANLESALPLVRLYRSGGTDDGFRLDTAMVEVDAFAGTRAQAVALAARLRAVLLEHLSGRTISTATGDVVFTACSTTAAPTVRPWANPAVVRVGATYSVRLHTR